MTTNLKTATTAGEIIEHLSVSIYEPPFSLARESILQIPECLRNVILIIDFDTEVLMNGILGFIENSTGAYLPETIAAFEAIGAFENARHLAEIRDVMRSFGVTHKHLRQNSDNLHLHEITTFAKTHGESIIPMAETIQAKARHLYCYDSSEENPYELLEKYVEQHREDILLTVTVISK